MPRTRQNALAVNVVTSGETLAVALQGVSMSASNVIDLEGVVDITTGVATTAVVVKLVVGPIVGGSQIASVTATVTAGNRVVIPIRSFDARPADVANQQYAITVTQTAATGNGTINSAVLFADF